MNSKIRMFVACVTAAFATGAWAAPGDLDTTFSANGVVTTESDGDNSERLEGVVLDASGNIFAGGYTGGIVQNDFVLSRFDNTGALLGNTVTTFPIADCPTGNGHQGHAIAMNAAGDLFVAGGACGAFQNSDIGIAKYSAASGALDASFGADGTAVFNSGATTIDIGYGVAVDASGQPVVVGRSGPGGGGSFDFQIVRFTTTGTVDDSFTGAPGLARAVAIDAGGNYVVAGFTGFDAAADMVLMRYTSAGVADPAFNSGAAINTDIGPDAKTQAYAVAIDGSGRIVVAGTNGEGGSARYFVARYLANGTLDGSLDFTIGGGAGGARGITFDASGNIIVAGIAGGNTGLARITDALTLDPSFGTGGVVNADLAAEEATAGQQDGGYAVAVDNADHIVVVGDMFIDTANQFDLAVSRFDNAPPAGVIEFSAPAYSVAENGVTATITATRTGGTSGAVSIDYATADNTATAGMDYVATSGTLNWGDGVSTDQTFDISITDDAMDEMDETVDLSLSNPTGGATLGAQDTAVLTITDDDPTPTLSIDDVTVVEGDAGTQYLTFTVSLSAASGLAVDVDFATVDGSATSGSDYTTNSGTLNFLAGETSHTVDVEIQNDTVVEGDETFTVDLSNPVNATILDGSGLGTIQDDDVAGSVQFSAAAYSVAEAGASILITATRTGGSDGAVSIDFATSNGTAAAGSDYTANSGTLNWADGDAASKTFSVAITDDNIDEADETVNLTLSNPIGGVILGAPSAAVLTIADDDVAGTIQFSAAGYTVMEDGISIDVIMNRTGGSDGAVSVDYATADGTATSGSDYTGVSGTANWADGDTAPHVLTIMITNDALPEGAETFLVNLTNPTNGAVIGTASVTVTINEASAVPPAIANPQVIPATSRWVELMLALALLAMATVAVRRRF